MNYSAINCEFNINESTTYFVSLNWNTLKKKKTIHWLVDKNAVTTGCGHRASIFPLRAMVQYLLIQCSGHCIEYNYQNTKNQICIYWKRVTISTGILGFPSGSVVKNLPVNAGEVGSIPGSQRSPREGNGNPLQQSCLEKSHGQRSLASYSSQGRKESDRT